jgi:hypothetical protein
VSTGPRRRDQPVGGVVSVGAGDRRVGSELVFDNRRQELA